MRRWPQSLKTALEICLDSRIPTLVWWGPDLIQFYNDCFRERLGSRHPGTLGIPAREAWVAVWEAVGPDVEQVIRDDRAVQGAALVAKVVAEGGDRDGCRSAFRYAPLHDRAGRVAGVFVSETGSCSPLAAHPAAPDAYYRDVLESLDIGFCTIDMKFDRKRRPIDYRFVELNPAFERHTGLVDATGRWMRELCPGLEQHWFDIYGKVALTGEPVRFENIAASMEGRFFDVFATPIGDPGSHRVALFFSDITERRRAQEELRISNERLQLAIGASGDAVWDWDVQTDRVVVSPRLREIMGYEDSDVLDHLCAWLERIHPADLSAVTGAIRECREGESSSLEVEFRMSNRDGAWKWLLSRGVIVERDRNGEPTRLTGVVSDVTQKKRADEQAWRHANFDALSGLPNRRLFRDRLDWAVQKAGRSHKRIGLLFIDLDRFKEVNDLHGHSMGDLLLCQAAGRIRGCVRTSDTVARLGGDEFTVILDDLSVPNHVEVVAQEILDTLSAPFTLDGEIAYVSGSLGVALYPDDGGSSEELIRKADQAMYAAKKAGKNQFSYFTRAMDEKAHRRLMLSNELRKALHAGQLELHYQPIVDLQRGEVAKAEALLRWNHPRLGAVEPSTFIPLAEESGVINEIGDWVFREAAMRSKKWSECLGEPFQIAVNKSPVQFHSVTESGDWLKYLEQLGLPANSITVELTEGILLDASAAVTNKLFAYRDAGVQLAIDDFGTGYSSMSYLKKFAIDFLKIDQSFVRDIEADAGARTIAESIIVMAQRLGLRVIAEGIETPGQMALLEAAGCDFGQGFIFCHPVPPAEFEELFVRVPR